MYQGKYTKEKQSTSAAEPLQERPEIVKKDRPRRKKAVKRNTIIFYSIYGVLVLAIVIAIACVMSPLRDWLVRYEASQPEKKAEEVFTQLFADPNWADLYTRAGMTDTAFEGKDAYAKYMETKVGTTQLSYIETSAGLSGDHKYIVRLGDEKIATFRLTGETNSQTQIDTWELGAIEVFFERTESVLIEKLPEQTVYINGVALDDSYTIRTTATLAEEYLPEGVHGFRLEQQYIDGLLVQPEVTVKDADGNEVALTRDAETGMYKAQLPTPAEMTEDERALALGAAKADAEFSIRAISTTALRKYFDSSSQVYSDIVSTHPFLQSYRGYSFDDSKTEISQFYRYSDSLFSVNVKLQMNVIRSNGTIKQVPVDKTYFFTLQTSGKYLVTQYTNIPIQQTVDQVRLTFLDGQTQIDTLLTDSTVNTLTLPKVTAPQGQVLKGWAVRAEDDNGKITMTIVFTPTEDGTVQVSQTLEPMTLYAVFEAEEKVS